MDVFEKFSVVMCVYAGDEPEHFRIAVESLLHQTVIPNEIILVVDGPVPAALDKQIVSYESEPLFRVIRLKENRGLGNGLRVGTENCSYELIARMDADDICELNRFERQLAVFHEFPETSVVGGQITEFVDDPADPVGKRTVPCTNEEIKQYLKSRCPMNHVTVILRKKDLESVDGYLDWYCNEDYYLWVRMYLAGMTFRNVPDNLVNVRVGREMYSRRGGIKYFNSERKLQKLMLDRKIISIPQYLGNITKRLIVQVLLPNRLRGWVFHHFARE